jgi:hypothetical protein
VGSKPIFICQHCGYQSSTVVTVCPDCGWLNPNYEQQLVKLKQETTNTRAAIYVCQHCQYQYQSPQPLAACPNCGRVYSSVEENITYQNQDGRQKARVVVNTDDKHLDNSLAVAQLEKLKLEIEHLKNKDGWEKRVALYTPFLSVLIAVAGFLFGVYQFQRLQQVQQNQIINEQQNDRLAREAEQAIRVQNQIRSDVEQILQFPNDKEQTISKVSFLFEDLKSYLDLNPDKLQTISSNNKRSVSVTLVSSVMNDCDFDRHRDVNYANILISQWEDYGQYLKEEDSNSLQYILGQYQQALRNVYDKDPYFLRNVRYVKETYEFSYPKGYGRLNAEQVYHFQDLLTGFEAYVDLLKDEEIKKTYLSRTQGAMCNGVLMEQLFGVKFNPQSAPEEFAHCSK